MNPPISSHTTEPGIKLPIKTSPLLMHVGGRALLEYYGWQKVGTWLLVVPRGLNLCRMQSPCPLYTPYIFRLDSFDDFLLSIFFYARQNL